MKDFNREAQLKLVKAVMLMLTLVVGLFAFVWAFRGCWNFAVAPVFGLPLIGYWQGAGIMFVAQCLMKHSTWGKLKLGDDVVQAAALKLKLLELQSTLAHMMSGGKKA